MEAVEPSEREQRSCKVKIRHGSRKRARQAMQRLRQAKEQGGQPAKDLMIYSCEFCGGWHVGHSSWNAKFRESKDAG